MKNKTITQSLLLGIMTLVHINTFAQNSGPNSPDFSRFEPVDAADMVNLLTGDFVYTLPILSVPNRGYGAHPIALSYSAGIMPDQEASWVGLGWTLNPGSIKPNINGTPDDHAENRKIFLSTYQATRDYYSIGVGVGPSDYATANLGYTWGSEGYNSLSASINLSAGIGLYKGESGRHSLGIKAAKVSLDLSTNGVSYKSNLIDATIGTKLSDNVKVSNSLGISYSNGKLSSSGGSIGISATVSGEHKDRNYSVSTSSTSSSDFNITIPFKLGYVSFSKINQEIKQLSTSIQRTYGNLYPHYDENIGHYSNIHSQSDMLKIAYNEFGYYSDRFNRENNILSYPAKDSYAVFGQGVSGNFSIQHNNQGLLYGIKEVHDTSSDLEETFYRVPSGPQRLINKHYEFHFNNEMSYKVSTSSSNIFTDLSTSYLSSNFMDDITNSNANDISSYRDNLGNLNTNYLLTTVASQNIPKLGKQNIEWFTNEEIVFNDLVDGKTPRQRGFIEASCLSTVHRKAFFNYNEGEAYHLDRSKRNQAKSIGAYSVTTFDGMVYNYSLPVYNYETLNMSSHVKENGDNSKQLYASPDKYVTNWLLTSIVGPDYIDVNNNGPDEADYGYWVEFNYGQFTNGYQWKFPYSSADEDTYSWELIGDVNSKSMGRKDIYYLNSIKTKSHTAFFIKDSRTDALGSDYKLHEHFTKSSTEEIDIETHNNIAHKVLRLSKVILLENKDAYLVSNSIGDLSGYIPQSNVDYLEYTIKYKGEDLDSDGDPIPVTENYNSAVSIYQMDNVLDQDDINGNYNMIVDRALQIVEFNQDYSLGQNCDNCTNGKLTLNSINIKARGGTLYFLHISLHIIRGYLQKHLSHHNIST